MGPASRSAAMCTCVRGGGGHINTVFVPFLAWFNPLFVLFRLFLQARKRQLEQRLGEGGVLLLVLDLTTWDQLAEVLPCAPLFPGGGGQLNTKFYPFWHGLTPFFVLLQLFCRLELERVGRGGHGPLCQTGNGGN